MSIQSGTVSPLTWPLASPTDGVATSLPPGMAYRLLSAHKKKGHASGRHGPSPARKYNRYSVTAAYSAQLDAILETRYSSLPLRLSSDLSEVSLAPVSDSDWS